MSQGLIESSQEGGATVARVACRQIIDQAVINGIYQQVSQLSEKQQDGKLVVDLADVEYMSGVTLSMFVLLDQAAAKGGNRIGFCQLSPAVDELFRVSRFHKVVNVFGTRKEAIDGLSRKGHASKRGNNRKARRHGQGSAVRELVGVDTELENSMSGILPGLGAMVDNESAQIEADRHEMLVSELPTFAEAELVAIDDDDIELVVENMDEEGLIDAVFDESDSGFVGIDDTTIHSQPAETDTTSSSDPVESQPQVSPSQASRRTDAVTTLFGHLQDADELLFAAETNDKKLPSSDVASSVPLASPVTQPSEPNNRLSEISHTEFIESDWARLFAAAEAETSFEPDFVVEQKTDRTTVEKPQWIVVDPEPKPAEDSLRTRQGSDDQRTASATTISEQHLASSETPKSAPVATADGSPATTAFAKPADDGDIDLRDDEDSRSSSYDKHMVVLRTGLGDAVPFDPMRAKIVGQRHVLIAEFLRERQLDAFVLTKPSNFAWFTAGGIPTCDIGSEPTASLVITPTARLLLCPDSDVPQLFGHELAGLGFTLVARSWFDDQQQHLASVVRGREVACDQAFRHGLDLSRRIAKLRLPLTVAECQSLRNSGRILSQIVELTARSMNRGNLENTVAGHLLHRLAKNDYVPVRVQVQGDGRGEKNRQWNFGHLPIERFATINVIARRKGLHVGISRTVSFGPPTAELRQAHRDSLIVQSTAMFNARHRADIAETWESIDRAVEKTGRKEAWQSADLGCVTGYELNEAPLLPDSRFELLSQMPLISRAAIGPAMNMDTILVRESIFKVLTKMEDWPQLTVQVKGAKISRPDILTLPR